MRTLPFPDLDPLLAAHGALLLFVLVLLRWLRRWPGIYLLSVWPGTVAHELMHAAAGLLTGAQPVSFSVLPRRRADGGWILGEVGFTRLHWWNSVPVALAPLALLPVGGWMFMHSTGWPLLSAASGGWKLLSVQCLIAAWPSPRDWSACAAGLLVITALVAASCLLPEYLGIG